MNGTTSSWPWSVLLLFAIHLFGIYVTFGLGIKNGYYEALMRVSAESNPFLPGSTNRALQTYTGISFVDYLLTIAQCMYANVTDGSAPALSLYAFQFSGQLVSVITVVMIEGWRMGNQQTIMAFAVFWLLATVLVGHGVIMGLYATVHLVVSRTARTSDVATLAAEIRTLESSNLAVLPVAVCFGYLLPTLLMAAPIFPNRVHQYFTALWQVFPLLTIGGAYILKYLNRRCSQPTPVVWSRDHGHASELTNLYHAYFFAFATSAATQGLIGIILLFSKTLFFFRLSHASFSFMEVFIPPIFTASAPITNMAEGAHIFFQYDQYVGFLAAITWAVLLLCTARQQPFSRGKWLWLAGEILLISIFAGPGACLVTLMWYRDEHALLADEQEQTETGEQKKHVRRRSSVGLY